MSSSLAGAAAARNLNMILVSATLMIILLLFNRQVDAIGDNINSNNESNNIIKANNYITRVPPHVGKLFKTMQESVCDGQILKLKCIEDYTIDITTVELSTITEEVGELETTDTKVSTKLLSSEQNFRTIESTLPSTFEPSSTNNNNFGQTPSSSSSSKKQEQQQPICPPLDNNDNNYALVQQQQQENNNKTTSSSTSGNGKENNIWNNNNENNSTETLFFKTLDLNKEEALSFVKSECHAHTSCTLDFRLPPATAVKTLYNNKSNITEVEKKRKRNRRLLEIAYKCRPSKLKARTVCRNSKFQLECPQEKVILIVSAEYGGWPNDTKTNEICSKISNSYSTALNRQQQASLEINKINNHNSTTQLSNTTAKQVCTANQATTTSAVISACFLKRNCQFDVQPDFLGDTKCQLQQSNQAEYLKVVHVCANESLLKLPAKLNALNQNLNSNFNDNNSTSTMLINGSRSEARQQQQQQTSFHTPGPPIEVAASTEQEVAPSLIVHEPQTVNTRFKGLGTVGGSTTPPADTQQSFASFFSYSNLINGFNSNFASSPGANNNRISKWSLFYYRHEAQLIFVGMLALTVILIGFVIKTCQHLTIKSSSSSSGSSTNSCSKDSQAFPSSSLGSSTFESTMHHQPNNNSSHLNKHNLVINSFMTGGGTGNNGPSGNTKREQQHQQQRHNSCSESCFSLDDYNLNNNCNGSTATNSPALNTATTTTTTMSMNDNSNNQLQDYHNTHPHQYNPYQHPYQAYHSSFGMSSTIVKPKLWTNIHGYGTQQGNEAQQRYNQNSTLYYNNNGNHTLRPTRTFAGHPTPAPQIRCLQQLTASNLASNNFPQQVSSTNANAANDPSSVGGNILSSNDLLLAMASAASATQQMTANGAPATGLPNSNSNNNNFACHNNNNNNSGAGWCALAPATAPITSSSGGANHQQAQQQLIFSPPAMQVELQAQQQPQPQQQQQLICGGGNLVEEASVGPEGGGALDFVVNCSSNSNNNFNYSDSANNVATTIQQQQQQQ